MFFVLFLSVVLGRTVDAKQSGQIEFLATDDRTLYKAALFEGAEAVNMRWNPIVSFINSSANLGDFDYDPTRRRLVFSTYDQLTRTISVSECYLVRPNDDRLSCSLSRSLLYRQIIHSPNSAAALLTAADWLTGEVYILLPGLFVRCPLPPSRDAEPECQESIIGSHIRPSMMRVDPFSRSVFWSQNDGPCAGLSRASLVNQINPLTPARCLLHDDTISTFSINLTSASLIFANGSRDAIFELNYQTGLVSKARSFVQEIDAGNAVNCPFPVESLSHYAETDVFFWTSPDLRKNVSQFAFEVDGLCSTHPTPKNIAKMLLLRNIPRINENYLRSTMTEQVRCQSQQANGQNFDLNLRCSWVYTPVLGERQPIESPAFYLIEIGNRYYYRARQTNFATMLTEHQLVEELKMGKSAELHVAIRVCSNWHCALPANVNVRQSPFSPKNVKAFRAVTPSTDSSYAIKLTWRLPHLFQGFTTVNLAAEQTPDSFIHQTTTTESMTFEGLQPSTRYVVNIETCNIVLCTKPVTLVIQPNLLEFENFKVCWNSSTLAKKSLLTIFHEGVEAQDLSGIVTSTEQPSRVASAVNLLAFDGTRNFSSVAWIDTQRFQIYLTLLRNGETRMLYDSPVAKFRRRALAVDFVTWTLYWIESDSSMRHYELHSLQMSHNRRHRVFELPNEHNWQRISINSTAGLLFVMTGVNKAPSFAFAFDLLKDELLDSFNRNIATNIGNEMLGESQSNCQSLYDDNLRFVNENSACFNINRTVLSVRNTSESSRLIFSLIDAFLPNCDAPMTLHRLILKSSNLFLLPANSRDGFSDCVKPRNGNNCFKSRFSAKNSTVIFKSLQPYTEYDLFIETEIPLYNTSRLWKIGTFKTEPSIPSEPMEFTCKQVTPEEIYLEWKPPTFSNGPIEQIEYVLKWQEPLKLNEKKLVSRSMEIEGATSVRVTHLSPDRLYEFEIMSRSRLFKPSQTSRGVFQHCKTGSIGKFNVQTSNGSKVVVSLNPLVASPNIKNAKVAFGLASDIRSCSGVGNDQHVEEFEICTHCLSQNIENVTKEISTLQPAVDYRFCLILETTNGAYIYPKYSSTVVQTGGFKIESPRCWSNFGHVEVLILPSEPEKSIENIGYQLLYSDKEEFCGGIGAKVEPKVYNVTHSQRSILFSKERFEANRRYWFRLAAQVNGQIWFSDCSNAVQIGSTGKDGVSPIVVDKQNLVAATGIIALISCISVVAFCLSVFAFCFLFRRINSKILPAKTFFGRYICRWLGNNTLFQSVHDQNRDQPYRFDFTNFDNRRSSTASALPIYSVSNSSGTSAAAATMLLNSRKQSQQHKLWSFSDANSPLTAHSQVPTGGSVFSFDCDLTTNQPGFAASRFTTLNNQIYATPSSLSEWMQQLPPNILRLTRDQIQIARFLGAGAFGEVYEGTITVPNTQLTNVAVKSLKPDADSDRRASFCREAALMSLFEHENIVRLIGICVAPSVHSSNISSPLSSWPLMVLELMNCGDLLGFLRRARPATEKTTSELNSNDGLNLQMTDLLDISIDVAAGCRYLEKKRFCHRDIAARNCLVSCPKEGGRRIVKIGDFGLARSLDGSADCYKKVGEGLMPVRWMSPESLNDGIFTTHSDVWSFGVLMYEVFSLGRQPYAGRANHEVFEIVKTGSHPECPRDCPTSVCHLMLNCFQIDPQQRPTFKQILKDLRMIRAAFVNNASNNVCNEISKSSANLVNSYATLIRQQNNQRKTALTHRNHYASMRALCEQAHLKSQFDKRRDLRRHSSMNVIPNGNIIGDGFKTIRRNTVRSQVRKQKIGQPGHTPNHRAKSSDASVSYSSNTSTTTTGRSSTGSASPQSKSIMETTTAFESVFI